MNLVRSVVATLALAGTLAVPAAAQTAAPPKSAAAASGAVSVQKPGVTLDQCEKQAGDRAGDARKAFLKSCLKPVSGQQGKMKQCNVEAKGKKGDDRRAFMSECLRKKKA